MLEVWRRYRYEKMCDLLMEKYVEFTDACIKTGGRRDQLCVTEIEKEIERVSHSTEFMSSIIFTDESEYDSELGKFASRLSKVFLAAIDKAEREELR